MTVWVLTDVDNDYDGYANRQSVHQSLEGALAEVFQEDTYAQWFETRAVTWAWHLHGDGSWSLYQDDSGYRCWEVEEVEVLP